MKRAKRGVKRVGLALGGGGAKGLAHILMLEALDELGIVPSFITGTSIGAVIGVLYCSGRTGRELRETIEEMSVTADDRLRDILAKKAVFRWLDFVRPQFKGKGLLKSQGFIDFLFKSMPATTFDELRIPLRVVASDFWSREQVVLETGPLRPAIQASMCLPGVFNPVVLDGRVLIDGGAVNPVPFDLLPAECDLTIAVDVLGRRTAGSGRVPSLSDAVFNTFQIMERSIVREKLHAARPDIYVEPEISDVRMLEFYRAGEIFKQAQSAKDFLKRELKKRIGSRPQDGDAHRSGAAAHGGKARK